ncbi:uncharacterized protein LY79DRAFT_322083 [Colletotrichum navitas]|uniref:Uncharacterized protein n=1 Tax=Colletotrichum navitas TaxID=681940 RepID=A0AAD8VAF3_9PEZI|nr:uncharacterized protein LY79DRAFT_322083 [Colletotrichum navitas]KAK1597921.1 hypothetical protein LY79DRAFT_322083 [Colletotrichum navitas]
MSCFKSEHVGKSSPFHLSQFFSYPHLSPASRPAVAFPISGSLNASPIAFRDNPMFTVQRPPARRDMYDGIWNNRQQTNGSWQAAPGGVLIGLPLSEIPMACGFPAPPPHFLPLMESKNRDRTLFKRSNKRRSSHGPPQPPKTAISNWTSSRNPCGIGGSTHRALDTGPTYKRPARSLVHVRIFSTSKVNKHVTAWISSGMGRRHLPCRQIKSLGSTSFVPRPRLAFTNCLNASR